MRTAKALLSLTLFLLPAFSAQAADELVVYSARKEEMIKPLLDDFSKQTGIAVTMLNDDSAKLIARLESEGARTPADVLLTVDVMNAVRAGEKGLVKPVKSDILTETVPAELRDEQGRWFALGKRARVIFYNKDQVKPEELSTYEALADAKWKGKLITRSSSNVYTQSLIASMIAAHGEEGAQKWASGVAANLAKAPGDGDMDLLKSVGAGAYPLTVANTYYFARLLNSTVPGEKELMSHVGVFWPNQKAAKGEMQGVHVNVSTGAVVAATKHEANAVKLLEFLVSEQAQRFYADSNQEYPVNAKVPPSETLQSLGTFKADDVSMPEIARHAKQAVLVADKAGWK